MEAMIAALVVFCFAIGRFNVPPASTILPPPRANTTVFRYWLYGVTYGVIGVGVFLAAYSFDGLKHAMIWLSLPWVEFVKSIVPADSRIDPSAFTSAFMIAILVLFLPKVPLVKIADRSLRRFLYARALIPAEQLRLCGCARTADFTVDSTLLEQVRDALEAEGFDREDINCDDKPTTRSLWTKVSVLIHHIERWEGLDQYKTAFAVLKERDSDRRSSEHVKGAYEAFKGDAKTCFKALREQPGHEETQQREERFRYECKRLLDAIYALVSRVSLQSHYSDRERVASFEELGFRIKPRQGGPVPDSNDVICLLILLGMVVILPLSQIEGVGFGKALMIGGIYFAATLTPLLLAAHCPVFAMGRGTRTPAVACPVVSGLIAVALGFAISMGSNSISAEFPWIDLSQGWQSYCTRSYPWSFLVFLIASLLSVFIRIGKYPDVSRLTGIYRYRQWGSLTDALIFAGCTAALMIVYIIPTLMELRGDDEWLRRLLIPTAATFVIGFFVPTWYRANTLRAEKEADAERGGLSVERERSHDHIAAV